MAGNMANLALDGGDARLSHDAVVHTNAGGEKHIDMTARSGPYGTGIKTHDPAVSFEEYLYFARVTRSNVEHEDPSGNYTLFGKTLKKSRNGHSHFGGSRLPESYQNIGAHTTAGGEAIPESGKEKEAAYGATGSGSDTEQAGRAVITEGEWVQASRALRTASWGAVFFLITTDILGPFSTAWAFAAMGYGPGVALFTVFGFLAGVAGFMLWKMFLGLDSDRYPLRSYGDIAFRIYGSVARHTVNILQSIQLFFNVAIILVVNALSTEEVIAGPDGGRSWCFIAIVVLWAVVGAVFAQIRTLKNLAWIANLAIWLNVFVMISSMAIAATNGHDYQVAYAANGPLFGFNYENLTYVATTAGEIPAADFSLAVNGLGQAVFSYGGAMLFVEFMAEMRRPFDFWKGMLFAQMFIYFFYMLYGLVIYSYQGQFTINPSYQGIQPYTWQTVGNIIELVTSVIAALLYGNIGVKVIYNNVLIDLFRFPDLSTRGGKLIWVVFVPIYWAIAFIIGSAIPQVSTLQAFIASLCILQFSYTFPPWLMIGYLCQRDSLQEGEGYNPATGQTIRHDHGMRRWARGFRQQLLFNTWNTIFMLGALATAGLGLYAAIEGMIATYSSHPGSSFTCNNPYDY